ncbi:PfkB family carbohydrate kinase [Dactylosporangium sp. CA-052675]|uniref:sugar kinase n=1 Tax=Dactylosporangium sp. CA-052675 TaxID=3239927 RepID=UPI003D8D93BC
MTGEPGAAGPRPGEPDTAGPQLGKPGTAGPRLSETDTAGPRPGEPDTTGPQLGKPGTAGPRLSETDTAGPRPGEPDTTGPQLGKPGTAGPRLSETDTTGLQLGKPGTAEPRLGEPGAVGPRVGEPDTAGPCLGQTGATRGALDAVGGPGDRGGASTTGTANTANTPRTADTMTTAATASGGLGSLPRGPIVVGLGEAMVLFQPASGESLASCSTTTVHVAGAELNLLAAARRAGVRAAFCSRVGADPFGERVLAAAAALGVETDLVAVDAARPTGVFAKDVRDDGARRVYYYRNGSAASAMDENDAERALNVQPAIIAVSGLTAALGDGPRRAVARLGRAVARPGRAPGVRLALDPNLRPGLPPVTDLLRELLPVTTFLLLGIDEAGPLLGTEEPREVFRRAAAAGVREVVLKAGADGCWYAGSDGPVHMPTAAVRVVDPVGGGDAFAGAYLAARLCNIGPRGAAWLGTRFAAGVIAAPGDTDGLPEAADAAVLVEAARLQTDSGLPMKRTDPIST